jgi:glutamate 5-kinase
MKSKLLAADLITFLGIPMHVANGFTSNVIQKIILENKKVGTFFPQKGDKNNKAIKTWLAVAASSKGKIVVSTYLADILKKKQPASILFVGIEAVDGRFEKDDVVDVYSEDGIMLGKGQCRYNSDQLKEELTQYKESRTEGAKIEGGKKIAVHYNNFVFC